MNKKLRGTGVALITPFDRNKNIDYPALEKVIRYNIDGGIDYLVVQGTTGESVTLNRKEKAEVLAFVLGKVNSAVPVVLGIGGNNTGEVIDNIAAAELNGVSAVLSVSPYYNKPQQEGIYQHYSAVATVCPLPVILYNVPGRTGSNMTAETTLRLATDVENIIAVKEASGNLPQVMEIIHRKPAGFEVISGDDILTVPLIAMGAMGVISVAAQAVPRQFSSMVNLALEGNFKQAAEIHYSILDLMNALFADGSPAGIKAALHSLGLCQQELRLPLVPVNLSVSQLINKLMSDF